MISVKQVIDLAKRRKKIVLAAAFLIAFFAVLIWAHSRGLSNPVKPREEEAPKALEHAFLRWFRGENDELLANFQLINHTDNFIGRIEITCVAYYANEQEAKRYNQKLNVSLMPSEARMLNRAYIGALDPLAQTVNCRIERWE
ncbi:MAG: hypothetical protein LBC09_00450 [Helicobacteraceae bacterium]|jgi:hypothetical protein|nr:hypothetical protein [Helicobacteraceae bacterium]